MMAKNENKTITVNDVEHNIEDLTEQQIAMVNHVADLDKKLGSLRFNMDQLESGPRGFCQYACEVIRRAYRRSD
jgi:hypothetical protein